MSDSEDKTKYILIGCGIAALIGLCGVGSCLTLFGGAAFMGYQHLDVPAKECKAVLAALRSQDIAGAYERLAPEYKQASSQAAFEASVRDHASLLQSTEDTLPQRQVVEGQALMGGFLSTPAGSTAVECELVEKGEAWQVTALRVAGEAIR